MAQHQDDKGSKKEKGTKGGQYKDSSELQKAIEEMDAKYPDV